jgi:hypothetical protein
MNIISKTNTLTNMNEIPIKQEAAHCKQRFQGVKFLTFKKPSARHCIYEQSETVRNLSSKSHVRS